MAKKNLSRNEELTRIIRSSIESAENKGVQVAISGGVVVSAKKGWIKNVFDGVEKIENAIEKARETANRIQNTVLNVAEGWNDVRILDKVEQGLLLATDVAAEKAKFAVAKTATKIEQASKTWLKKKGASLGAWIGRSIGTLFSPAGAALGGAVGSYLGDKCGEWTHEKVAKPLSSIPPKKLPIKPLIR